MRLPIFMTLLIAALALTGCAGLNTWVDLMWAAPDSSVLAGDPVQGQYIFANGLNGAPPCRGCHQVVKGSTGFALGPNLAGVGARAMTRIEGLSGVQYIEDSILHPHHYVVPGFRDIMYPAYADHFSEQDVADLVAYLITL